MPFWFPWETWIALSPEVSSPVPIWGELTPGLPGMIATIQNVEKISRIPETDITFGTAVLASGNDGYCRSANTGTDSGPPYVAAGLQFLGIAMRDMTAAGGIINPWERHYTGYRNDSWCASIVCVGRVWTIAQSVVHENDPVVIASDGTFMTATNPALFIPCARWVTSAPAGMLAIVEVNMPQVQNVRFTRDKLW